MRAARAGTGYDKFAAGFAAGVHKEPLSDADEDDPDYKAGAAFAEEYESGYKAGFGEGEVMKVGDEPINPLSEESKVSTPRRRRMCTPSVGSAAG